MRKFVPVVLAGLAGLALAQTASNLGLVINGRVFSSRAIVVSGKTYVPLEALQAAGVRSSQAGTTLSLTLPGAPAAPTANVAAGGANARVSLEGCVGETLFNGVWRLTVKGVDPIPANVGRGPGWGVTVELRNGTKTKTILRDTGLESIDLVLPDGNTLLFYESEAEQFFIYKELIQAGAVTYQLKFYSPDRETLAADVPRPDKLIVQLDPKRMTAGYLAGVAYTTPTPSFRVRLDCQK